MDITAHIVNGGFHVWLGAPAWLVPESAWARRQVASFVNCHVSDGRISLDGYSEIAPFTAQIFPNPAKRHALLEIELKLDELAPLSLDIEIIHINGTLHSRIIQSLDQERFVIPLAEELPLGLYQVHLRSAGYSTFIPLFVKD